MFTPDERRFRGDRTVFQYLEGCQADERKSDSECDRAPGSPCPAGSVPALILRAGPLSSFSSFLAKGSRH